jgi:WD40 repeat protein
MAPGLTADNAGLAFSHDGRKFAVSGGSEARMWDLESGQVTAWQLPEGLVDTLVFDATGTKLFLFRMETADWIHAPDSNSSRQLYPRVCRVRDLLASPQRDLRRAGKHNPAWETAYFDASVFIVKATPDGRFFVAAGARGFDKTEHLLKVFDCATGKDLLSIGASAFHLDATGNLLQFTANDSPGQYPLIEIPSGKWAGSLNPPASALGPGAHLLANEHPERFGHTLYRRGDETPLVSLGIDTLSAEGHATFSLDGTRLAWGNQDGTVTICYLAEVQRRLASIGFGW